MSKKLMNTQNKSKHCSICGAKHKKRHSDWCPHSLAYKRILKATGQPPAICVQPDGTIALLNASAAQAPADNTIQADPKTPVTRVALVIDSSGSMHGVARKTVSVVNAQIDQIKQRAAETGQATYISLYTFNHDVTRQMDQEYFEAADYLTDRAYRTSGTTALQDAVGTAIDDLKATKDADEAHVSFLVLTVTDGYDNASSRYRRNLSKLVQEVQATDRWSVGFLCPKDSISAIEGLGIHSGNIQAWDDVSERGVENMGRVVSGGVDNYFQQRSKGRSSTRTLFTDLSTVTQVDLDKLQDVSGKFHKWTIPSEAVIRDFVNTKLSQTKTVRAKVGDAYETGRAFYELTKPEKVQVYKNIVIKDRQSGRMFGGKEARDLLGLPTSEDVRVKPGNHADFKVFVESTSTNRKLVRGTELLYCTAN